MPSRRSVLGTAGALLGAGCVGTPAESSTTTTATTLRQSTTDDPVHVPTQLEWGSATTYDGTDVRPTAAWTQHSVITLTTPDSFGVEDVTAKQYCFIAIDVQGTDPVPQPDDFAIDAAGERYDGWTSHDGSAPYRFRLDMNVTAYDPTADELGGWIGFVLPTELGDDSPRLRVQFAGESEGATRWPLPDDVTQALNAPAPHITLDKLAVPDAVPAGESFEVTLTARNEGRGDGIFRAAVNEAGPQYMAHAVRLPVGAGSSDTTSVSIAGPRGGDVDETTIRVVTTRGRVERTVSIE